MWTSDGGPHSMVFMMDKVSSGEVSPSTSNKINRTVGRTPGTTPSVLTRDSERGRSCMPGRLWIPRGFATDDNASANTTMVAERGAGANGAGHVAGTGQTFQQEKMEWEKHSGRARPLVGQIQRDQLPANLLRARMGVQDRPEPRTCQAPARRGSGAGAYSGWGAGPTRPGTVCPSSGWCEGWTEVVVVGLSRPVGSIDCTLLVATPARHVPTSCARDASNTVRRRGGHPHSTNKNGVSSGVGGRRPPVGEEHPSLSAAGAGCYRKGRPHQRHPTARADRSSVTPGTTNRFLPPMRMEVACEQGRS